MVQAYNSSYPTKVMSSFYDNYVGVHQYDLIKKITLRINKPLSEEEIKISKMLLFFQMVFPIHPSLIKEKIESFYGFAFGEAVSNELKDYLNKGDFLKEFDYVNYLLDGLFSFKESEAFVLFLLITIRLSEMFGYPVVVPTNLIKGDSQIQSERVRHYFNISFLSSLLKKEDLDLKRELIAFLKEKKEAYNQLGIKELYLFGSINDKEYHDSSDFDLVIRYSGNPTYEKINQINDCLRKDLFNRFQRKSDLINYDDFILIRDINNTTRII